MKSPNRRNRSNKIIISDPFEKFAKWQKELNDNLSTNNVRFQEILLYFINKNSLKKNEKCELPQINNNICSLNKGINELEPDADFFIVDKATWYSLRGKISNLDKPLKKLGYFCNKKLVVNFDDLCYFFYKDRVENKINEGYLTFTKGQNSEDVIYVFESYDINNFFKKINADLETYKQILYFKGTTFELTLKQNINNKTGYDIELTRNVSNINSYKNRVKSMGKYNGYSVRIKLNNDKKKRDKINVISCEINKNKNYNFNNISNISNVDSTNVSNNLYNNYSNNIQQRIGSKYKKRSYLLGQDEISFDHFPENKKLTKSEEEKLDKIIKCIIYYYYFIQKYKAEFENSGDGYKEVFLCLINKEWLDYFIKKFNFLKIKEYLDIHKPENLEQKNYKEFKEIINTVTKIKDFLLIKKEPIKSVNKEFTESGNEFFNNYDFINKTTYEIFIDCFSAYDMTPITEYRINILKDSSLILNYSTSSVEITTNFFLDKSKTPQRYLVILNNSKYMNYKIRRPLQDKGLIDGLKNLGIEFGKTNPNDEYQITVKKENIGYILDITTPPDKNLGNYVVTKPIKKIFDKFLDNLLFGPVILSLCNIKRLTGYLLNEKRMKQIELQIENKILINEYINILKEIFLLDDENNNSNISLYNLYDKIVIPYFNFADLFTFLLQTFHKELNKIESPKNYTPPNDSSKYNYQLMHENFMHYFNTNHKSIISELFFGIKNTMTTCQNCSATTHDLSNFYFLNFDLDDVRVFKGYSYDTVNLNECFEYNEHKFSENEENYCGLCKKSSIFNITSKIIKIPNILIIIFNRKIAKDFYINLNYEETINLKEFVFYDNNTQIFELIGVISNLNDLNDKEENYVTFCKSSADKNWYFYGNEEVRESNFDEVKKTGVSNVLIYSRIVKE